MVRPGELNLMTGGRGISHSEVSTPETSILHGVQMWLALPASAKDADRRLDHFEPEPLALGKGSRLSVFLGTLHGVSSPVHTHSPLLGAELHLAPGEALSLETREDFEHGVLVDLGEAQLGEQRLERYEMGYLAPGADALHLYNPGEEPARLIILGGEPFDEDIIMWWNFVGRSHEEIVEARTEWQAASERFGEVEGYVGTFDRLPAPELPNTPLKPRTRPS